ncbi:MAG TPA: hypothetical protein VKN76_17755 [Kiloniellaceae bacterium]|nr:hypothetical protein [Kiloniellaceae bacterium]
MGDVIKLEDYRADFERRQEAKIARRKRQQQRLSGNKGEKTSENSLPASEDRIEDDPA